MANLADNVKQLNLVNNIINKTIKPMGFISKFQTVGTDKPGAVRVLAETVIPIAGVYEERQPILMRENKPVLIELNPKARVGRATEVSNVLFENAVDGFVDNLVDLNEIAIEKLIEGALLDAKLPDKTYAIEPLIKASNMTTTTLPTEPIKYDEALGLRNFYKNQGHDLKNAFFLMNGNAKLSVQNDAGQEFLNYDNIEPGADAMLFGRPVYFTTMAPINVKKNTDGTYNFKDYPRLTIVNSKGILAAYREVPTQIVDNALPATKTIKNEVYVDIKRQTDADVLTLGYTTS